LKKSLDDLSFPYGKTIGLYVSYLVWLENDIQ
jgi:hypothetical protein